MFKLNSSPCSLSLSLSLAHSHQSNSCFYWFPFALCLSHKWTKAKQPASQCTSCCCIFLSALLFMSPLEQFCLHTLILFTFKTETKSLICITRSVLLSRRNLFLFSLPLETTERRRKRSLCRSVWREEKAIGFIELSGRSRLYSIGEWWFIPSAECAVTCALHLSGNVITWTLNAKTSWMGHKEYNNNNVYVCASRRYCE